MSINNRFFIYFVSIIFPKKWKNTKLSEDNSYQLAVSINILSLKPFLSFKAVLPIRIRSDPVFLGHPDPDPGKYRIRIRENTGSGSLINKKTPVIQIFSLNKIV